MTKFKLCSVLILFILISCNFKHETINQRKDSSKSSIENYANAQQQQNDSSFNFISYNYLKLTNIYLGSIFNDNKGNNIFFRIIEIPDEENLILYAEKISIGEEGGNYKLLNRYQIGNEILHSMGGKVKD
jgi:hypothetical protein